MTLSSTTLLIGALATLLLTDGNIAEIIIEIIESLKSVNINELGDWASLPWLPGQNHFEGIKYKPKPLWGHKIGCSYGLHPSSQQNILLLFFLKLEFWEEKLYLFKFSSHSKWIFTVSNCNKY